MTLVKNTNPFMFNGVASGDTIEVADAHLKGYLMNGFEEVSDAGDALEGTSSEESTEPKTSLKKVVPKK